MENKVDGATWIRVTIIVAIIGCFGALGAAFISILPDIINSTPTAIQTQALSIVFLDNFDGATGSYDTTLWDCEHDCNIDNLVLKDGILRLQRSQEGWSSLVSRYSWAYNDINSLEGKLEISSTSDLSVGWIGITKTKGCDINGFDSPFIWCYYGSVEKREYTTREIPIEFDKWYKVRIEFRHNPRVVRFYLDDILIGEYSPITVPDTLKVNLGIYSQTGVTEGSVYFDDVKLTLNK